MKGAGIHPGALVVDALSAAATRGSCRRPPPVPFYDAYSSVGPQAQIRFLSPYALLILPTDGQNLCIRVHGAGNAAFSRL
jgi:hypothetical protein